MIDMSSRTARVAVTAGLVSALTLGGGAITALAEVSKADVPAMTAPVDSAVQVPAATVENQVDIPVATVEPAVDTVAQVTSPDGKTTINYSSLTEAVNNARDGVDDYHKGSTLTLVKSTNESFTVNKVIKVTAKDDTVIYSGSMTVTRGVFITGINFAINDDSAAKGITSNLIIDGDNGKAQAALIGGNTFEINVTNSGNLVRDYSSITVKNGAVRTWIGFIDYQENNKVRPNIFNLSTHDGNGVWYGVNISGSSKTVDGTLVSHNTVNINGQHGVNTASVFFVNIEGGQQDTYGVTNITITENAVTGASRGANGLSVEGVNGLFLTDNTFTNLNAVVTPALKTNQFQKSDNIILGGNDMGGTLWDCAFPSNGDPTKYLGDNGIIRKYDDKGEATEKKYSTATYLVAGLKNKSAKFSSYAGGTLTEQTFHGTQLFHSVTNAVSKAVDGKEEIIMLYGNSTENAIIPANKQVTLELSGKTIIGKDVKSSSIVVENGGKLIIDNSASGAGVVRQQAAGLSSVEVQNDGDLTIKDGYYIGAITADKDDKANVRIEGGNFSVEPNAAWVADGKGFEKSGSWFVVADAKLEPGDEVKDGQLDVDVEATTVGDDEAAFKNKLIEKAAKVNVNGYTVAPTDETKQKLEDLVVAVKEKKLTSYTVTYRATKDSSGTAIKESQDAGASDATVTVTYNLTSPILTELEQKVQDANGSLTNNPNKTDVAKKELQDAIDKANGVLKNPVDQKTVEQAKKDLEDAINKFIGSPDKPTPGGGGGGGSVAPAPKTYTVTFDDGVSHTADLTEKVTSGSKVTKPADPTLEGYVFKGWFADAALTTAYDFDTPVTGDLTLHAKWALATTDPLTFTDVDPKAWYVPGVDFVTSHGLMLGYGDTGVFGVGKQLTRGELAVILARFAAPGYGPEDFRDAKNETGLPDVADGRFYTWAANWAVENGVINGYADAEGNRTGFGPDDPVTMEQLVAIIANLADKEGPDKADAGVLAKFRDPLSVSPWATQSVAWAVERGLINGSGENGGLYLHGSADIMRERVAVILMNAFHNGILSFE